ncbi:hypothetical protein JCM10020v2_007672 [Rhodotorula toruloides]
MPWWGFASEYILYARAAAAAKKLNYTFLEDDRNWNYGRLSNYFLPRTLSCVPPSDWSNPALAIPHVLLSLSLRNLVNGDFLDNVHSSLPRPSNLQRLALHSIDSFLDYSETLSQLSGVTRLTISGRLPFKPILGFARRSYKRLTCQTKTVTADELVTLLGYGRSTLGRLVLDISLLPIAPPPSVGVTFEGMSRVLEHAEVAGVQVEGKAVQEHRVEQRRRAMREVGTV